MRPQRGADAAPYSCVRGREERDRRTGRDFDRFGDWLHARCAARVEARDYEKSWPGNCGLSCCFEDGERKDAVGSERFFKRFKVES